MIDAKYLLTDIEMARFLVNGYHLVQPELPAGLNERIAEQLDMLSTNPGDAITETAPDLWQVLAASGSAGRARQHFGRGLCGQFAPTLALQATRFGPHAVAPG